MNTDKPYLIDSITGNSRFLASLSRSGRMYRLWWPHIDCPQHVDRIRSGIWLEGEHAAGKTTWFDDEQDGWRHNAAYVPQTNLFRVEAKRDHFPVETATVDFAVPGQDIHVREYNFTNPSSTPVSFQFIFYSSFTVAENKLYNTVFFNEQDDALVHYRQQYYFSIGSSSVCTGFQAGFAWDAAEGGSLNGGAINMTTDGALSWRINDLQPGQSVTIPVYIAAGLDRFASLGALRLAKSRPSSDWKSETAD
jgi:glucoamylase